MLLLMLLRGARQVVVRSFVGSGRVVALLAAAAVNCGDRGNDADPYDDADDDAIPKRSTTFLLLNCLLLRGLGRVRLRL